MYYPFCLSGSTYTTIALALERLNAMAVRQPSGLNGRTSLTVSTCRYPTAHVILIILFLSTLYNTPRFFETRVETKEIRTLEQINNTGELVVDWAIITVSLKIDLISVRQLLHQLHVMEFHFRKT